MTAPEDKMAGAKVCFFPIYFSRTELLNLIRHFYREECNYSLAIKVVVICDMCCVLSFSDINVSHSLLNLLEATFFESCLLSQG